MKQLRIAEYPTYLLFDKNGKLISTPMSGIAGVENELSGIFVLTQFSKQKVIKKLQENFLI